MKRSLSVLMLSALSLPIEAGWAQEAADAAPAAEITEQATAASVPPASLAIGEQLPLYSYTFLGIEVRPFTDDEFREFRKRLAPVPRGKGGVVSYKPGDAAFLRRKEGVLITHVVPGSPAEAGGLKVGEVLTRIGGAEMNSPENLLIVMRNCSPGIPMHMSLIDLDLKWKSARAVPVARPEPVQVGHIVPLALNKENMWRMKTHQVNAIKALAQNPVPFNEACDELEAICRLIYKGYTPGCLRLPIRTEGCTITVTRNGWNIDLRMTENGVETRTLINRYDGPHAFPEAVRQRLSEIDTTAPKPPSRWDEEEALVPMPSESRPQSVPSSGSTGAGQDEEEDEEINQPWLKPRTPARLSPN